MGSVLVRGLGATYVVLPGSRGPIGQEGPIGCVVCVYGPEAGIPNSVSPVTSCEVRASICLVMQLRPNSLSPQMAHDVDRKKHGITYYKSSYCSRAVCPEHCGAYNKPYSKLPEQGE